MKLAILSIAILFAGCAAQTTVYEDGKPVLRTNADSQTFAFRSRRGSSLNSNGLNHSAPIKAQGEAVAKIVTSSGNAATKVGTAIVAKQVIPY